MLENILESILEVSKPQRSLLLGERLNDAFSTGSYLYWKLRMFDALDDFFRIIERRFTLENNK